MQWHIITGSKGGVGKTLLTLLLLEYYLERKPDEGVLVLDLNAINTDTSAMLLYNKREFSQPISMGLENQERIILQQTFSLNKDNESCYFGVGWPADPFTVYEREHFANLLISIKNKAEGIEDHLEIKNFQHVIIDTNYHFCNLFPQQDQHYSRLVDSGITADTIHIWFLWVYRQLFKLLWQGNDTEREIMKRTASAIERVFEPKEIGSIIHTYTPVGLLSVPNHQGNFFAGWLPLTDNAVRRDQDYTIKKLLELEQLKVGSYIGFRKWMQLLLQARAEVRTKNNNDSQDAHSLFANVLDKATRQIVNNNEALLPINIFPLSIYQSALEGYTDKEREDAVAALRKMTIYKNFSMLLDRKYESLHL